MDYLVQRQKDWSWNESWTQILISKTVQIPLDKNRCTTQNKVCSNNMYVWAVVLVPKN